MVFVKFEEWEVWAHRPIHVVFGPLPTKRINHSLWQPVSDFLLDFTLELLALKFYFAALNGKKSFAPQKALELSLRSNESSPDILRLLVQCNHQGRKVIFPHHHSRYKCKFYFTSIVASSWRCFFPFLKLHTFLHVDKLQWTKLKLVKIQHWK